MEQEGIDKILSYVELNIDQAIDMGYEELRARAKEKLSEKIKGLKTYDDFEELAQHMQFFDLEFIGKRKKQKMHGFSHAFKDDSITSPKTDDGLNQVHYIYEEDESTGLSHVKNLNRVLDIA